MGGVLRTGTTLFAVAHHWDGEGELQLGGDAALFDATATVDSGATAGT